MSRMATEIPRDPALDSTLPFLREGYLFVTNRCDRLQSDLFLSRLMLREVVCMRGAAAAEQFYRENRFTRRGAVPRTALTLLQDRGSVQTLDGAEHRHRKAMFMELMNKQALGQAKEIFAAEWRAAARDWIGRTIVLHEAAALILTRAALRWCGVDPGRHEPGRRMVELAAMIDAAGGFGPRHLRAQFLRQRCERWARRLIRDIREGLEKADEQGAAAKIALHRDPEGKLLSEKVAAVELLNLLRPIVAISRYIVFAAHALHEYADRFTTTPSTWTQEQTVAFVQEVRRHYPFFPLVGGRVVQPFTWRGHRFADGDWVLLDLYGTNHDPQTWEEPESFRAERFERWAENQFTMIPQGGGGFARGHRCPGEWLTITLTAEAVRLLAAEMSYDVPPQDLTIPLARFPTLPQSGFAMAVQGAGNLRG